MPWCLCCAALSLPWPARCRTRSTFELRRNGLDPWREALQSTLIQAYEVWQVYGHFIEEKRPRFGPGVSDRMQIASRVSKAEADAARQVHSAARGHIRDRVKPGTIVALPSAPCIAPRVDTPADGLNPTACASCG